MNPKDELITYDPENEETYPSVCNVPTDVEARFGWTGGEQYTLREIDLWFDKGIIPRATRMKQRESQNPPR